MVPPDGLAVSDQTNPVPLPPLAVKVRLPLGGVEAVAGEMLTSAATVTLRVATFPSESTTWTMSVTPPVGPAV